ncbi:MAG: ABC transporter [Deltaproteobacteria bacterium RBG_13_49_15]|nr:MAG: ABC transporter [Deltaproteobacteria bacterium RBG_13_49_15]
MLQGEKRPDIAIRTIGLSKKYLIYEQPRDRLFQMFNFTRRKYYLEFWALQNIDFSVNKGETLGIIGRNGSGKSTLLQLICGTLSPTCGSVEVNGRIAPLLELGSGFNPEYTGLENVYLNGSILGMSTEEIERKMKTILAFADIGDFMHRPVKTYSSGMYARLAFAVAIHTDPQILLIDEILSVGDVAFQRKCIQRFYELRDNGCTILFVSHDTYQVKSICQKVLYLANGRNIKYGDASDVVDQYVQDMQRLQTDQLANDAQHANQLFSITKVVLENENGNAVQQIRSGETVILRFKYKALTENIPDRISFVFNLYRQDDFYVCGATTLMEQIPPQPAKREGEVTIRFPELPLTAGTYLWRVAINDDGGMIVHSSAKYVCSFRVIDDFRSVGLIDLKRSWTIQ